MEDLTLLSFQYYRILQTLRKKLFAIVIPEFVEYKKLKNKSMLVYEGFFYIYLEEKMYNEKTYRKDIPTSKVKT